MRFIGMLIGVGRGSRRRFVVPLLFFVILSVGGCTDKAKTIQLGADQFAAESLAAIEMIDTLRRKETTVPPTSPAEASRLFVGLVKNSSGSITRQRLKLLLDPLATHLPQSEPQWQSFLQDMRRQYTTFAITFASLDKGSLFAAPAVKKTIPILNRLITQLAAFGASIKDEPAEFVRERAGLAEALEAVRDDASLSEAEVQSQLLDIERQLRVLAAAEVQMTRDVIVQTLKAARLGTELRKLLMNYDKLTVADITEGLSVAFSLASQLTGKDLSSLQAETNAFVSEIQSDTDLSALFNEAVGQINVARSSLAPQ